MDIKLDAEENVLHRKVRSGRKPNTVKNLEVKRRDLRCRITDTDFEKIGKYFKGEKSKFLYNAVTAYIQQNESKVAQTLFTVTQHKIATLLATSKIDDFTLGLIEDVLDENDRQLLLAKMSMKLDWKKTSYRSQY